MLNLLDEYSGISSQELSLLSLEILRNFLFEFFRFYEEIPVGVDKLYGIGAVTIIVKELLKIECRFNIKNLNK